MSITPSNCENDSSLAEGQKADSDDLSAESSMPDSVFESLAAARTDQDEKIRRIIECSYDAFIAVDETGKITDWNSQAEIMFGWAPAEILGRNVNEAVVPERFRHTSKELFNRNEFGNLIYQHSEHTLIDNEGVEFLGEVATFPISIGKKHVMCAFIRDISYRKTAEDAEKRVLLMQEREDFMFTLTHDLKNPLIGANRILEQLANQEYGVVADEPARVLRKLQESNSALISLIQNIIEIYRYENNIRTLSTEELDFRRIVDECFDQFKHIAESRKIELRFSCPKGRVSVLADRNSMRRVLHNLVDNAIKFSPENEAVEISLQTTAGTAILSVHNKGEGISAEDRQFLFQRFWQGKGGKKYVTGNGLGLYLCNRIVTAHNGTISCISDDSAGTTFVVTLPLHG